MFKTPLACVWCWYNDEHGSSMRIISTNDTQSSKFSVVRQNLGTPAIGRQLMIGASSWFTGLGLYILFFPKKQLSKLQLDTLGTDVQQLL